MDGNVLPGHPFDPVSPAFSAKIPILIGTNMNEFVNGVDNPEAETLTEEELKKRVDASYGSKGEAILRAYRREYPAAKPFEIFSVISIAVLFVKMRSSRRNAKRRWMPRPLLSIFVRMENPDAGWKTRSIS